MDPVTHRRMRTAHLDHAIRCVCGRLLHGNGEKAHRRGEYVIPSPVKDADSRILLDERAALMSSTAHPWAVDGLEPLDVPVAGWTPDVAEQCYLDRFAGLTKAAAASLVPAEQPDGWGEGVEAADHPVNCSCSPCVIDRLRDSNDTLRDELSGAAGEIDRLRAELGLAPAEQPEER